MSNDWTDDIEEILSKVRQNCIDMYKYHLCRYFQYKRVLPLFRVPVLILNALNSVFSVGLQPYMEQSLISVLNCLISLIATLINSIEMYMGIQKSMETEMSSSQGFYLLSIGIYKMLTLQRDNRDINGKQYLMECYNTYSDLVRSSKLIKDPYMLQKDFLQNVNQVIGAGSRTSASSEALTSLQSMVGGGEGAMVPSGSLNQFNTEVSEATSESSLQNIALKFFGKRGGGAPPMASPELESILSQGPSFSVIQNLPYPPFSTPAPIPTVPVPSPQPSVDLEHLYSLSRKSIFGRPSNESSLFEFSGVNIADWNAENPPYPPSTKPPLHPPPNREIVQPFVTNNISAVPYPSPENSGMAPPDSHGLQTTQTTQPKEKGVKDIIQEIEKKPKSAAAKDNADSEK